jgi:hypothetical protein
VSQQLDASPIDSFNFGPTLKKKPTPGFQIDFHQLLFLA